MIYIGEIRYLKIKEDTVVKKIISLTLLGMTMFTIAACTPQEAASPTPSPEAKLTGVIVLGDIDADDPISKIQEFQPIADYLAENLHDFGIGSGAVKIAPDIDTMIAMVKSGEIDVYYDSLYPAMIVANATGAKPLIRGWRGGEPVYHSLFFALAESGISSVEDLNGKTIAYDDASSTSGYMMPTSYLISNGMNPVEKDSTDAAVADDEVGYVFSGGDENTIEWVLSGRVDAAVVDNLTFMSDIPEDTRNKLIIIAETQAVPRRVIIVGPDVDPELATALSKALIDMDKTEEGKALLEIVSTLKFDEFPGGTDAVFEPIQEMFNVLANR